MVSELLRRLWPRAEEIGCPWPQERATISVSLAQLRRSPEVPAGRGAQGYPRRGENTPTLTETGE